jgi:hypothetical protein
MYWINFSRTGSGAVATLPAGQSLNKDFFAGTVPPSIVDDRALSRPKIAASGAFLHLDEARPHLTSDQCGKFTIKRRHHPPYSPDLARCHFWPFGYLKHCLERRFFDNDIALEGAISETVMSIEPDVFVKVFTEWKHRLQQCMDQEGDYP